ncbi:MAG: helix-turn-helix domain-containing protein [Deltaproteobacteria bacterium]
MQSDRQKTNKREVSHSLEKVELTLVKQVSDLMTFLSEPKSDDSLYETVIAMVERALIQNALLRNDNIKNKAATYLGINRNTLQAKGVRLGVDFGKTKSS